MAGVTDRAAFNNDLAWGSAPGLLVVDMCQAYFDATSPLFLNRPEVVDRNIELVAAARQAGLPVLWSRVEFEPGGANGGVFYRKVGALSVFDRGGKLGDWVEGLTPASDDIVITKQGASSFFGTDLDEALAGLGVDTLLIGGVSTSGCVRATALDACQSNYVPVVVAEACGDRMASVHDASLFDLAAKYANVERLADVLARLAS